MFLYGLKSVFLSTLKYLGNISIHTFVREKPIDESDISSIKSKQLISTVKVPLPKSTVQLRNNSAKKQASNIYRRPITQSDTKKPSGKYLTNIKYLYFVRL